MPVSVRGRVIAPAVIAGAITDAEGTGGMQEAQFKVWLGVERGLSARTVGRPGAGNGGEGGEALHPDRAGLGAAHLEIVEEVVCETVQPAIAREAEDVIEAVCLAPRHGLGPSVVAVAPECEPVARQVPADAPHEVLAEGAVPQCSDPLKASVALYGAPERRSLRRPGVQCCGTACVSDTA